MKKFFCLLLIICCAVVSTACFGDDSILTKSTGYSITEFYNHHIVDAVKSIEGVEAKTKLGIGDESDMLVYKKLPANMVNEIAIACVIDSINKKVDEFYSHIGSNFVEVSKSKSAGNYNVKIYSVENNDITSKNFIKDYNFFVIKNMETLNYKVEWDETIGQSSVTQKCEVCYTNAKSFLGFNFNLKYELADETVANYNIVNEYYALADSGVAVCFNYEIGKGSNITKYGIEIGYKSFNSVFKISKIKDITRTISDASLKNVAKQNLNDIAGYSISLTKEIKTDGSVLENVNATKFGDNNVEW